MLRIIGALCIIVSCACTGILTDRRLYGRLKAISYFISAVSYLKINTEFSDMDMKSALIAADKSCGVRSVFTNTAENMHTLGIKAAWEQAVNNSKNAVPLTDSDIEILLPFGEKIGLTDIETQNRSIDNIIRLLNMRYDEVKDEYTKKGRLYSKCGVLIGMFTILILL